ncbi:family 4B encapsulin nanocompartment shell protein [Thermococcus sp.]|uniref:family 4B encapsulin nanocompartment shell protein n=1 Tax=Thermococcus sp. TaxID=35749 RepID=UPI00260BD76A|nr:family 4B encapsulin nanocompartment shell protein [Thermococcus sp.]
MMEVKELLQAVISDFEGEGLKPDILLAGPGFIQYAKDALAECSLKIYRIEELGYDAVVADSAYLGQMKRASRRVSIEPLLRESEMWKEIHELDV